MSQQENYDAWANESSGLNIKGVDRKASNQVYWFPYSEAEADNFFSGDEIAEKIVTEPVLEILRPGFSLKYTDGDTKRKDLERLLKDRFKNLRVNYYIERALTWARLYGGGAVILGVDEGHSVSSFKEPLNIDNINKVKWLLDCTRWQLRAKHIQNNPFKEGFGEPVIYEFYDESQHFEIHRSRLLLFHGKTLPRTYYKSNQYWHDSVLNNLERAISNFNEVNDSVATALTELKTTTLKVQNLASLLSSGKADTLKTRMNLLNLKRGVSSMNLLDESESLTTETLNLSGVADLVKTTGSRLVAATKVPKTIMLGDSAGGLGSTGEHESDNWYNFCARERQKQVIPAWEKLSELIMRGKQDVFKGQPPEFWEIKGNPFKQMTEGEQAEIALKIAEKDQINILNQVHSPAEIAVSRAEYGPLSTEVQVSQDKLDEFLKDEHDAY